jgi:hypothetical protein
MRTQHLRTFHKMSQHLSTSHNAIVSLFNRYNYRHNGGETFRLDVFVVPLDASISLPQPGRFNQSFSLLSLSLFLCSLSYQVVSINHVRLFSILALLFLRSVPHQVGLIALAFCQSSLAFASKPLIRCYQPLLSTRTVTGTQSKRFLSTIARLCFQTLTSLTFPFPLLCVSVCSSSICKLLFFPDLTFSYPSSLCYQAPMSLTFPFPLRCVSVCASSICKRL